MPKQVGKSRNYGNPHNPGGHQINVVYTAVPSDELLCVRRAPVAQTSDEVGTDAFTIKELMGHSSVTVSQRYVHPTTDTKERAFANLAASNLGVGTGHKPSTAPPELSLNPEKLSTFDSCGNYLK